MSKNNMRPLPIVRSEQHQKLSHDELNLTIVPLSEKSPRVTTAEEKFLREYRYRWEQYYIKTGEKRAWSVIECLTNALIEGGLRP